MSENASAGGASSVAIIATPNARKYLAQLCKHFQHKLPAKWTDEAGGISFPQGDCRLKAGDDLLTITLATPDPAELERLQDVVARHLVRFAFREELKIAWEPATG